MLEAIEDNLAGHFSFVPGLTEGMLVEETPDLVLVDSGLPADTFNAVCRAKLARDSPARQRIEESILHFQRKNLPFSWWVGPPSEPATLEEELERCGLSFAE